MRILQVNVVYKRGSTGKIVSDLHKQLLESGYDSLVCYGRGKSVREHRVHKVAPELIMKMQSLGSRISGYGYAGCTMSTWALKRYIDTVAPDVIHLHCLNGYFVNVYSLLEFIKARGIATILTLHAEFMFTAGCAYAIDCEKWKTGCGHCPELRGSRPKSWFFDRSAEEWNRMAEAFYGFNNLVVVPVSDWLARRAQQSPFLINKRFVTVLNGIDTVGIFRPTDCTKIKKLHGIENQHVLLHVTANFSEPIKGGKYVLEIADRFKDDDIKVVIVGYQGDTTHLPPNVIPVCHTQDQAELAAYYSMADLTLLTSKRETFSMVCAESLACGTPVVGFLAGGPESICLPQYSQFVAQGDINALENAVRRWITRKRELGDVVSRDAGSVYSSESMFEKYLSLYKGQITW